MCVGVIKIVIDTTIWSNFFYIITLKKFSLIKAYGVIFMVKLGPIEEIKHLQWLNKAVHLTFRLRHKILIGAFH